jgi:alkylhydroperoxidase/carboxymuconolactone decarboxylase family protein YurZ
MSDSSLPKSYSCLLKRYPVFSKALASLGETVRQQGPLDVTQAQLIQLTAAASIRSEGAVHSHTRRALELGANGEEIRHTLILLTSTIGFPSVAAALTWVEDIFD